MADLSFAELEGQNVELLPARTTMNLFANATGGNGGNGGLSILSGNALSVFGNATGSASNGGNGGGAANVFG